MAAAHRDLTCGMNLAWAEGVLDGLRGGGATHGESVAGGAKLQANLAPEPGFCCVVFSEPDAAPS